MSEFRLFQKEVEIEQIKVIEDAYFLRDALTAKQLLEIMNTEEQVILLYLEAESIVAYLYAIISKVEHSVDIMKVVVVNEFQNQGIGKKLMMEFERLITQQFNGQVKILLEARQTNTKAIALYYSCNFLNIGRRKNFYQFPVDDAIIFEKIVNKIKL